MIARALASTTDGSVVYLLLACVGLALSAVLWDYLARIERERSGPPSHSGGMLLVYGAALIGGMLGAKIAFLVAEGSSHWDDWTALLTGKSVTGALLGGYLAVEIAKRAIGMARATGDRFAVLVPISLGIGRIGCCVAGCCAGTACDESWYAWHDAEGRPHIPTQAMEAGFNLVFASWALMAFRRRWFEGNCFHLYLIAAGLVRFGLEFVRERECVLGPLGGYHFFALSLIALGVLRWRRAQSAAGADG